MPKSARRDPRPADPEPGEPRQLLARILASPHLARAIPQLEPELLHGIIQRCGLEDCADLVAHATADQLAKVFDIDLWKGERPGVDEELDADRFGVWLEVLLESGDAFAAKTVARMDAHLVIGALAQHVLVFDPASVPSRIADHLVGEIGGYTIVPRRTASWDAIAAVLASLDAEHGDYFHHVMRGCRRLSDSGREIDGLDDLAESDAQFRLDLAFARQERRERQGYLTPAEARAFLQGARELGSSSPHSIAAAYFRAMGAAEDEKPLEHSGVASDPSSDEVSLPDQDETSAVAAVIEVLLAGGAHPPKPKGLLGSADTRSTRLSPIEKHMGAVCERDAAAWSRRNQELGFLANVLLAGCSIQARSFTPQEAMDAAVAVCNLGLENWPAGGATALPEDFLKGNDLIGVFQAGWSVLHEDVCMYTAQRLVSVLGDLRCDDRQIQASLGDLRTELVRHIGDAAPWRAGDAFDVIAILDLPAWAALLALTGECPVMHAAIDALRGATRGTFSATAFEFVSENSQIALVREFMDALPGILRG